MSYEDAKFYEVRDPDALSLQSPGEALESFLEYAWRTGDGETYWPVLRREGPITVTGYSPVKVTDEWLKARIDCALSCFAETFGEEFGDPDDCEVTWQTVHVHELRDDIAPFVRKFVDNRAHVWRCNEDGRKTYSEAEVAELVGADVMGPNAKT